MDRTTAVLVTAAAGGLIALQAPVNGRFGRTIGSLPAASVSFVVGLAVLLAITAVRGELGRIPETTSVPWLYLTGGLFGAVYVTTVLMTVATLGAGTVVAATIAGQLTISLIVDQYGLLGVAREPITVAKVAGILLLAAGVFLIVRK